jgi:hypothetical protein
MNEKDECREALRSTGKSDGLNECTSSIPSFSKVNVGEESGFLRILAGVTIVGPAW